jgi:hypothetical protein
MVWVSDKPAPQVNNEVIATIKEIGRQSQYMDAYRH